MNSKKAAKYLTQAFSIALHNPRVKSMLQYGLVSPPQVVNWDSSLLANNGQARPMFNSLKSWVAHARGALAK
jgi:hypothetical protein